MTALNLTAKTKYYIGTKYYENFREFHDYLGELCDQLVDFRKTFEREVSTITDDDLKEVAGFGREAADELLKWYAKLGKTNPDDKHLLSTLDAVTREMGYVGNAAESYRKNPNADEYEMQENTIAEIDNALDWYRKMSGVITTYNTISVDPRTGALIMATLHLDDFVKTDAGLIGFVTGYGEMKQGRNGLLPMVSIEDAHGKNHQAVVEQVYIVNSNGFPVGKMADDVDDELAKTPIKSIKSLKLTSKTKQYMGVKEISPNTELIDLLNRFLKYLNGVDDIFDTEPNSTYDMRDLEGLSKFGKQAADTLSDYYDSNESQFTDDVSQLMVWIINSLSIMTRPVDKYLAYSNSGIGTDRSVMREDTMAMVFEMQNKINKLLALLK